MNFKRISACTRGPACFGSAVRLRLMLFCQ